MQQFGEFFINHWSLFLALAAIIFLLIQSSAASAIGGIGQVSPFEAAQMISHKDAIVVDVSEATEYSQGHILNALNIPSGQIGSSLGKLAKHKDAPVILSCRSGNRSQRAAAILKKNGFEQVYNLKGGLMAWKNAELPTVRK